MLPETKREGYGSVQLNAKQMKKLGPDEKTIVNQQERLINSNL